MPSRCYEFVDSRLRRSPPDRASAVPYGQAGENATRFPRLAHRSAAAHKLHSTPQQDGINLISGNHQTSSRLPAFSLFLPGSCPNNRDHRSLVERVTIPRTTSRDEWAEAFMDLSKLIIEGFEIKVIRARLNVAGVAFDPKDQSLTLFEKLLTTDETNSGQAKLTGLRTVQEIRSKSQRAFDWSGGGAL